MISINITRPKFSLGMPQTVSYIDAPLVARIVELENELATYAPMILTDFVIDSEQITSEISFTKSKAGKVFWGIFPAAANPSKDDILMGTGALDFGETESTTINVTGLTHLTDYNFKAYTINQYNIESAEITTQAFTTADLVPETAPVIELSVIDSTSIGFTIDQNPNGCEIWISTNGETFALDQTAEELTGVIDNLPADTEISVYGKNKGNGTTTSDSEPSAVVSARTEQGYESVFLINTTNIVDGYFIDSSGNNKQIQAATTTIPNDSLILPANDTDIINALIFAGIYSQFYTDNSNPKIVKLADITPVNSEILFKPNNSLILLPNSNNRAIVSQLTTDTGIKKTTVNLLRDSAFQVVTKNTKSAANLLHWDMTIPTGGSVAISDDVILLENRKIPYIKLTHPTSGTTIIRQDFYIPFANLQAGDTFRFTCYCNKLATGSGGPSIFTRAYTHLDGNTASQALITYATVYGTSATGWRKLDSGAILFPITDTATDFTGCFRITVQMYTGNLINAQFAMPCLQINGSGDYENNYLDLTEYEGIENAVSKLQLGNPINIAYNGDSNTAGDDTEQTSKINYWTKAIYDLINLKFGVTCDYRNNSGKGADNFYTEAILKETTIDRNADLVFMTNGRNTDYDLASQAKEKEAREAIVRRILANKLDTDILLYLPVPYGHKTTPIAADVIPYQEGDDRIRAYSQQLIDNYKLCKPTLYDKIIDTCDDSGLLSWPNVFGDTKKIVTTEDSIHPTDVYHQAHVYEFRWFLEKALRNSVSKRTTLGNNLFIQNINRLNLVKINAADFGTVANTVKSGTWINDSVCDLGTTSIKSTSLGGVVYLGEWTTPIQTSDISAYLEFTFTGKEFRIGTIEAPLRQYVSIFIDEIEHRFSTASSTFGIHEISTDGYNNTDNQGSVISLAQGTHTVRLKLYAEGTLGIAYVVFY